MTRKVRLHIDQLLLKGVARIDPVEFGRSLRTALAESLGEAERQGKLRGLRSTAEVDGGRLAKPSDPAALGRHIAGRISGGGS